jgi:hypothetical protein
MVVAESVKSQDLHLETQQGNVPFFDDESWDKEPWTIYFLCRKETNALLDKMEDVPGRFENIEILHNEISNFDNKIILWGFSCYLCHWT